MGTATTFSIIDRNRNYLGGMITTGMAVSAEALVSKTSQLPKIAFDKPKKLIGTNTVDCIKSGIMYSTASSLDGMIERIEDELGERCTVIATGGSVIYSQKAMEHLKSMGRVIYLHLDYETMINRIKNITTRVVVLKS